MNNRVGFSTTTSWISRLIRAFTKSRVSHAWLLYYDEDFGRDMVMESTLEGFRIVPYDKFAAQNKVVAIFKPEDQYAFNQGFLKIIDWLGTAYDFRGLFGMLWVLMGRFMKKKFRNPMGNAHTMFCSEVIVRVMERYPDTEFLDPEGVSPEDLMHHMYMHPTNFEVVFDEASN
jgi:hypothetical protein